jgi:hypothetical protein
MKAKHRSKVKKTSRWHDRTQERLQNLKNGKKEDKLKGNKKNKYKILCLMRKKGENKRKYIK